MHTGHGHTARAGQPKGSHVAFRQLLLGAGEPQGSSALTRDAVLHGIQPVVSAPVAEWQAAVVVQERAPRLPPECLPACPPALLWVLWQWLVCLGAHVRAHPLLKLLPHFPFFSIDSL